MSFQRLMRNSIVRAMCFMAAIFVSTTAFVKITKSDVHEKPIVVIIPSYNNQEWFKRNLGSVISQNYSNFRVIYINDCSRDDTGKCVQDYLRKSKVDCAIVNFDSKNSKDIKAAIASFGKEVNQQKRFFTLVNNVQRCGALENLVRAIYSCKNKEIIVTVDGDDWLFDTNVLKKLNEIYSTGDVWLTHGSLIHYPKWYLGWSEPIPPEVVQSNSFRQFKCPSHLRTFYAGLFKKIKMEDLLYEGKFYSMTWDMAMMFPMIEMAGERHAYISQTNYVYNIANQINDNKTNPQLQNDLDWHIRHLPPYQRLETTYE